MPTTVKLTPTMLKRMIEEEVSAGFGKPEPTEDRAKDTEEVEPDGLADKLEKHIDYVQALKIEEKRIARRLRQLRETKARILRKIVKSVG